MLETSCGVWDVSAADVLAEQLAVRTHEHIEVHTRFDVRNTVDGGNLFETRVVENARGSLVGALTAPVTVFTRRAIEARECSESLAKDLYLVEEVERFEARQHVALETEAERHHRHDHCHADD